MGNIKSNLNLRNKKVVVGFILLFLSILSLIWLKTFADEEIPNAPSNLTFTNTSSSMINITWTDNSSNEDKFNIERKSSSDSSYTFLGQVGTSIASYNDTSVTAGNTYDYRVQACLSGTGCSDYTTLTGATLPTPTITIPTAPSNLIRTTSSTSNIVSLIWTDNANNEDKFNVERKLSSATGWTSLTQITTANTTSYTDTTATTGNTYDYRVQACLSGTGCSEYATLTGVAVAVVNGGSGGGSTTTCPGLTLSLSNGKTSYVIGETVNYTWACTGTGTASNVYVWLQKLNGTQVLYNSGSGSNTQTLGFSTSNLSAGSYTLKACFEHYCTAGTTMATQTFTIATTATTPIIPSAPSNLTRTTSTSIIVPLTWTDNANNEDKFNVERKLSSATGWTSLTQITTANTTSYTDTTATAGNTYDYRVQACLSGTGCSEYTTLTGVVIPASTTNNSGASCPSLTLALKEGKNNYVIGETVNYTWACTGTGTASNVYVWLQKLNGTQVLYNSGSGSNTQTLGFSTSNLSVGSYTLKACFEHYCTAGTTMATQTFTIATTATTPTTTPVVVTTGTIPTAPSNLTYTSAAIPLVLRWTDNANNEDKFNIERKLSSETAYTFLNQLVGANISYYYDSSVLAGKTYDYRVQACLSGTGCSEYTTLRSVSIPVAVISNNTTTPVTTTATPTPTVTTPKIDESKDETKNTQTEKIKTTEENKIEATVITSKDINEIVNTISTPLEDKKAEVPDEKVTELIYKDTNKDGISDYDSKYIYNIDPVKESPTSTYEGKKINASEKILLGFDPTKTELVKVNMEQPVESVATVLPSYKVKEVVKSGEKEIVFKGQALPNSFVTVYIYSTPIIVTIKTDSNGEWQYSFDKELENGSHTMYVATVNNTGNIVAKSSPYVFTKTAEAITLQDLPIDQSSVVPTSHPGLMEGKNLYFILISLIFIIGATLTLIGLFSRKNNQV